MKKLYLILICLIPSWVLACMPPFPWEVMVWRISFVVESASWVTEVGFSSYQFPFRNYQYENPTSWHWQNYSDTTYPDISSGSLVITLTDYQDGSYPRNYSIFHITTLSCEDNTIKLGKKYGTVMGWNRKKGSCNYQAHSLLDVFIEWNEKYWTQKLQEKYPDCATLFKNFPGNTITNNTPAPSSQNDVVITQTGYPWLDWILRKIDTFFGLF